MKFSIKDFLECDQMWPNPQQTTKLVTFTEEILNEKLHFLCSVLRTQRRSQDPHNELRLGHFAAKSLYLKCRCGGWGEGDQCPSYASGTPILNSFLSCFKHQLGSVARYKYNLSRLWFFFRNVCKLHNLFDIFSGLSSPKQLPCTQTQ